MTDDEADFALLSLANEKRNFGIDLVFRMSEAQVGAFERGIDRQLFTLVDVYPYATGAFGTIIRVFRLTDAGVDRLAELREQFK
jgi:hypothetical protein